MEPRKRIVIFAAFYEPFVSGAERMVVETVRRLAGRFSIVVVTAWLDAKLPRQETKTLEDGSAYEIVRLGFGRKWDKYLYPLTAALWTLGKPHDLVHAVMESYAGVALWAYRLIGGVKPTILTLQSGDLDMPSKRGRPFQRIVWKGIHTSPTVVVGISKALTERARRLGALRTMTIPNGVDFGHLAGIPRGEKIPHRAVTVARLSPEKGLPFLIEAMADVRRALPDAELIIVGGGALEQELKALVATRALQDAVRLLGAKPNVEAMAEVAKSGVFVLPSLGEGLGIVLLEAQALGVPVIGTNVGGIPDVIVHEKTGLLVPASDAGAIAAAIVRILKDGALAGRMVAEAQARLEKFDWNAIAEHYAELYQKEMR